jgi:hypothetical protein
MRNITKSLYYRVSVTLYPKRHERDTYKHYVENSRKLMKIGTGTKAEM